MSILSHSRASRKGASARQDDLAPANSLAGWHGRPGRSGVRLARSAADDGRVYLAILIPEPLDGVELLMTRRYLADMGAQFTNAEPEHAA
jgi:hypothetical protein